MSIMKDPYTFIEWKPDRDCEASLALDCQNRKRGRNKNAIRMGDRWLRQIYDLITIFIWAAVVVVFLRLLFNW